MLLTKLKRYSLFLQGAGVEYGTDMQLDLVQALLAACGVWILVAIGSKSLLLASSAVTMMLLCLPVAYFFYRLVFQVWTSNKTRARMLIH